METPRKTRCYQGTTTCSDWKPSLGHPSIIPRSSLCPANFPAHFVGPPRLFCHGGDKNRMVKITINGEIPWFFHDAGIIFHPKMWSQEMNLIFADGDSFFIIFLMGRWLCSVVNWRGLRHISGRWDPMGSPSSIPKMILQSSAKKKMLEYGMKTDFGKKRIPMIRLYYEFG